MVGRIYVRERMQALRSVLQNAVLLAGRAVVLSSNSHCMLFMPLRSAAFAHILLRKIRVLRDASLSWQNDAFRCQLLLRELPCLYFLITAQD